MHDPIASPLVSGMVRPADQSVALTGERHQAPSAVSPTPLAPPPRGDDVATVGIPGESLILIRIESAATFSFALHSRDNTRLLAGGPLSHDGTLQAAIAALAARCSSESAYAIERTPDGHVLALVDETGRVIGRSAPLSSEALSRAMLRLTAGQARRARVVHLTPN